MTESRLPELMRILKGVSRSFYLSIRILKKPLRGPIGIAYLLARISDTIADTEIISAGERVAELKAFGRAVAEESENYEVSSIYPAGITDASEAELISRVSEVLDYFRGMSEFDRSEIKRVLEVVISGQVLDLERFDCGGGSGIKSLENANQLDDYTWRVAGVVGSFWNRICAGKGVFDGEDQAVRAEEVGVRFGKGLQLVNILRDLPGDLANRRCYLPADELKACGLDGNDLVDPANWEKLKPVYMRWLERGEGYLIDGWTYVLSIPSRNRLLRLACAWPVLIGLETLELLRGSNPLEPGGKVKVTRSWIGRMMRRSAVCIVVPGAISGLPSSLLGSEDQASRMRERVGD